MLLIKFPSRNRPEKFLATLQGYASLCNQKTDTRFLITLDSDDASMIEKDNEIHTILSDIDHKIIRGTSTGKIDAINRDMEQAGDWDILLLASDDMIPQEQGYDTIIRTQMKKHYKDGDGVLWFNDGYVGNKLNTLVCMGHKYYNRFNYIYNPIYKSFFCDNEFMDVANRLKKQTYIDQVIIKHEHPANTNEDQDELYKFNFTYWDDDERTYLHNKVYPYDLSVLICSLIERRDMLKNLLREIEMFKRKSKLKIEVLFDMDDRQKCIGQKRNDLISKAKGKYCCFIDDDDQISPMYFSEIEKALECKPDCVAIIGMYYENGKFKKPFVHTIECKEYHEDEEAYYRPPNHLNPILTGLVRKVGFTFKNFGEDTDFAMLMCNKNLLKTEGQVQEPIYHYFYVAKK
jgi:hypothetical protein